MLIIMSTRCNIGFYGDGTDKDLEKPEVLLYRHSDGYPEGVLPDIVPFLKRFNAKRGLNDTEYASAWLMFHLVSLHADVIKGIKEEIKSEHIPDDGCDFLGNGICGNRMLHGDIEYLYAVFSDRLEVYSVYWENDKPVFTAIKTVSLLPESLQEAVQLGDMSAVRQFEEQAKAGQAIRVV